MSELLSIRPAAMRQAATRCFPSLNWNATLPWLRAITVHTARRRLINPRVVYPNWRMSGSSEASSGAGTLKVSLEYPAGVFTLANECIAVGGSAVTFPAGNLALTFNVTVPRGAKFWLRPLVNIPSGVNWTQMAGGNESNYGIASGDFMDISTSAVADHTDGGAVGAANGSLYLPMVIATEHREAAPIIFGTSRAAGGTYINDSNGDAGIECVILGRNHGYTNHAIAATLLASWNAGTHNYLGQLITAGYWTHVINEYGINDTGDTAAALAGRRTTFASWVKGLRSDIVVIGETLYPRTSSTDGYASKANQTISSQPIAEFNNLVRTGISGEDYCWDAADGLDPTREGKYPVTRNPNDASYTPTLFTAGLSGTTLTVSSVTSGPALGVGVPINAAGAAPSLWIVRQLSGTAGTVGTYEVNRAHNGFPNKPALAAGTSFTTAGYTTRDGLHAEWLGAEMIVNNKGPALLDLLAA
ncbi:hypothetical protein JZX87_08765 [Agrobacterium sp. Ap1]|uniref:hypothetical protein n=1 Tax=Agrobacterium sp. Ap1 TaxID=2815337 RepID=UPI001A8FEBFB|nr:hypothetical protein [Agrobacterium sp. Ap1]MBO0141259.1 hypothetical protein [Agrobacterium sp. Ap1]